MKPVISIYHDTRKSNKDGLYLVCLRATFQVMKKGKKRWVQKLYSLKEHCSEKDFEAAKENPRTSLQKKVKLAIVNAQARAGQILESHAYVNIELFERLYNSTGNLQSVAAICDIKIEELKKEGRIGSADLYTAVKSSVLKFTPGLTFVEITPEWIRKYVTEMELKPTTAGIYLRHLRAIYRRAMELKLVSIDQYPFGRGGYMIKKTRARKIALTEEDKNRLLLFSDPELKWAVDFWVMSYFSYGLNMTDIALLKVGDLRDDLIMISREKTKHTDSNIQLVIPIGAMVKEIILRHGNKTLNPSDYVFPILCHGLTPRQVKNRIKDFTKKVNAGLKKVEEKLKLEIRLTTYTARHTFAMMALRKNASKEFIQDALGHSSMMTTENYLSGFDVEQKRAISDKL